MKKKEYLEAAYVTSTHGVNGAVRMQNMTDSPDILAAIETLYLISGESITELHPERVSVYKGALMVTFREIDSLDGAIALKGKTLFAKRCDLPLPDGAHFIADMIGLPVRDVKLGVVGVLDDVIAPASQQIYVVKRDDGSTFMIPAVDEFILSVVTDGDLPEITVSLIPGMLD